MPGKDSDTLHWASIMGFTEPKDRQWPLVRAAQLKELNAHTRFALIVSAILALLCTAQFWPAVPPALLLIWLGFHAVNLAGIALEFHTNDRRDSGAPRSAITNVTIQALLFGLFWSIPLLFFLPYMNFIQIIGIAAFAVVIIGATPVICAAVPMAGIALAMLMGGSLAISLYALGLSYFAVGAILYALCNGYALYSLGGSLLTRLRDKIAHDEKSEVIDLLLTQRESSKSNWIWQIDGRRRIVGASPRFCEAAGIGAEQLEGMPLMQLLGGKAWERGEIDGKLYDLVEHFRQAETFRDVQMQLQVGGETRFWRISGTPQINSAGNVIGYRGVIADVTDSQASERKTYRMAHYDTLTGLANRSHFNALFTRNITRSAEKGRFAACLMIDLDRFKAINDTLGHLIGDKLLEEVAKRLNSFAGPRDQCGRLGGDEFAMFLSDIDSAIELDIRARSIIKRLSEPYLVDDHRLHIGASIGSSMFPKDGRSGPTLLRNADLALYQAKERGRGIHRAFEATLLRKAEHRRAIELELREALENDQFTLVYQPVCTLEDGAIAGFEALLRWKNSKIGDIAPDEFLPIAEETRLIDAIGEWVVKTACEQAAKWPERYRLAINLSAGQLRNPRLANIILAALRDAGLAPQRLEVETTEAILSRDNGTAFETFEKLRNHGVTLALDDFGSGHSTLALIGQTRFNSIKIDRDFISAAEDGSEASIAVIRAVIAMAESLRIATIVEGVENDRQFALAKRFGCRQVQGYYLDKPMDADAILRSIAEHGDVRAA